MTTEKKKTLKIDNPAPLLCALEESRILSLKQEDTLFRMQTAVIAETVKGMLTEDFPEALYLYNARLLSDTFKQSRVMKSGWSLEKGLSILEDIGVHKRAAFMSLGAERFDEKFAKACRAVSKGLAESLPSAREALDISSSVPEIPETSQKPPKPSV